jgi:hypothetical protein
MEFNPDFTYVNYTAWPYNSSHLLTDRNPVEPMNASWQLCRQLATTLQTTVGLSNH